MTQTHLPPPSAGLPPAGDPARRRTGARALRTLGVLAAVAILLGGGWVWLERRVGALTLLPTCTATALEKSTSLDPEQAGNAATIAAVAVQRGLPARAATIGIATAIQESKLRNLDHGDRDSVGLFQQRPSQGWGTPEQLMDPVYAANAFYDVLVKIEDYPNLPITQAAQKVQRSAFPAAYADHEPEARIFASALAGHSEAALDCSLRPVADLAVEQPGAAGLTPRAAAVVTAARAETGRRGAAPSAGSASSGAVAETSGPAGTSAQFVVTGGEADRLAWALAQWAVSRADGLDIESVAVAGQRWSRDGDGWTDDTSAPPSGTVVVTVAAGE